MKFYVISLIIMPRNYDFFFFNDTATTEIYTLSLHDALPIYSILPTCWKYVNWVISMPSSHTSHPRPHAPTVDRKSTRLNSSHANISYAVFCLKKKNPYDSCLHLHM